MERRGVERLGLRLSLLALTLTALAVVLHASGSQSVRRDDGEKSVGTRRRAELAAAWLKIKVPKSPPSEGTYASSVFPKYKSWDGPHWQLASAHPRAFPRSFSAAVPSQLLTTSARSLSLPSFSNLFSTEYPSSSTEAHLFDGTRASVTQPLVESGPGSHRAAEARLLHKLLSSSPPAPSWHDIQKAQSRHNFDRPLQGFFDNTQVQEAEGPLDDAVGGVPALLVNRQQALGQAVGNAVEDTRTGDERAITQSVYIPARYNPSADEGQEIQEFIKDWSHILKRLQAIQDQLECSQNCTAALDPEEAKEHKSGGPVDPNSKLGQCLLECGLPVESLNQSVTDNQIDISGTWHPAPAADEEEGEGQTEKVVSEADSTIYPLVKEAWGLVKQLHLEQQRLRSKGLNFDSQALSPRSGKGEITELFETKARRTALHDWTASLAHHFGFKLDPGVGGEGGVRFKTDRIHSDSARHTSGRPEPIQGPTPYGTPQDPHHIYNGFLR